MIKEFEFGPCQCIHDGCEVHKFDQGPALLEVERDGKTFRSCTRCSLAGDNEKLIGKPEHPEVFWEYDALGAVIFLGEWPDENTMPHMSDKHTEMLMHSLVEVRDMALRSLGKKKTDA